MASAGVATRDWSFAEEFVGRTPGTTIRNPGPQAARMARTSWLEATTPSSPALLRKPGEGQGAGAGRTRNADFRKGGRIHASENRHAEQGGTLFLAREGLPRSPHHRLAAEGVQGKQPDAWQPRSRGDRPSHGVRNVVELQVEEYVEPEARERFDGSRAFCRE